MAPISQLSQVPAKQITFPGVDLPPRIPTRPKDKGGVLANKPFVELHTPRHLVTVKASIRTYRYIEKCKEVIEGHVKQIIKNKKLLAKRKRQLKSIEAYPIRAQIVKNKIKNRNEKVKKFKALIKALMDRHNLPLHKELRKVYKTMYERVGKNQNNLDNCSLF